jgi:hypothetical protein
VNVPLLSDNLDSLTLQSRKKFKILLLKYKVNNSKLFAKEELKYDLNNIIYKANNEKY